MTIAVSEKPDYIVYRFGTKDKIELEFPKEKNNAWDQFTFSWYFRGGGAQNCGMDINYFDFTNGDFSYEIYQVYSAEEESYSVGILIFDEKTKKTYKIEADLSTVIGTLADFRDNEKIRFVEFGG